MLFYISAYECICCGYGTNVEDRMTRHLEVKGPGHNNECTRCCEKFSSHDEYKTHIDKVHEGVWTYRCGLCYEIFEDKEKRSKYVKVT